MPMKDADPRPPRSARMVACPSCGKPALYSPANPWRPFCGERCRTHDLGAWATESYRIPAKPAEDEGEPPPDSSTP